VRSAFGQLTQGLIALHDAHKVHRDIKPANVLVTNDGRVVILDFGIVAETRNPTLAGLEQEGRILGTPAFMAPEQALGDPVGPAADWYSCGVLLYLAQEGRGIGLVNPDDVGPEDRLRSAAARRVGVGLRRPHRALHPPARAGSVETRHGSRRGPMPRWDEDRSRGSFRLDEPVSVGRHHERRSWSPA
jgi:serine/threonine protein kinase